MRISHLFTKTRKEAPADEVAKNAQLLIRAGYIHKEMAGVYSFLPLGLRVTEKIASIVRLHLNAAGCQEVKMTLLQDPEAWKSTGRWSDDVVDSWFKTTLKNGTELGLGLTHEEPLARIMKNYIHSYRDVPVYVYQIQAKLRNETRAKSGIMRGREFLMKDLYSFSRDEDEHFAFYEKMKDVYAAIFKDLGLGEVTYLTYADGGIFGDYSHEFQTITDAGEDTVYLDRAKGIAVNKEVYTPEVLAELGLDADELEEVRAAEVGNIFPLADKQSGPLGLTYETEQGKQETVYMGSYGIGITRLMGVIAEVFSDEKGLVWPAAVAPFAVHLVALGKDEATMREADEIYGQLCDAGIEVLYDDRNVSAGEKLGDADLIGVPVRVVVSDKSRASNEWEVTDRASGKTEMIAHDIAMLLARFGAK